MSTAPRFAVAAAEHLSAFLQDATTGLAARCTDINTRQSLTYLPTTWNFPGHKRKRQNALPLCAVSFEEGITATRSKAYARYTYWLTVACAVGKATHGGDPDAIEFTKQYAEWALREVFDEETAWNGHTLGDRVQDAYMESIGGGVVRLDEFREKRAVYMGGLIRVTLREAQTHP
jgi:hypothetical protein